MNSTSTLASPNPETKGPILMRLMMLTVMMSSMSALLFHAVLPQISREFGLSLAEASWLSSSYALIYAFGTVTYGKLADRFQLRSLLTFGLLLFAAGSFVGLVSHSFPAALLGRCLQSAGAAAIPAAALLIPVKYFPPERRGRAFGMTAVGLAIGGALGPVVSALIISVAHWRWLFMPSLLLLLLLPLYRKHLDLEAKDTRPSFDWLGGALLAAGTASLLLGVTSLHGAYLLAAGGLLLLFAIRIRYAKEPFIDPALFQNGKYTAALAAAFLVSGIGVSLYFLSPVLLADVHHLSSTWIGFAMVPAAAASALLGRKAGRLADRKGNAYLITIAAGLLNACFLLLSTFAGSPPWVVSLVLALGNVGQSFYQIAMSHLVSQSLPKDRTGVGMGLFSMTGFLAQGMASGIYGIMALQGASVGWNPFQGNDSAIGFSNLYLALALLHGLMWCAYRMAAAGEKGAWEG
ncbi:MFS transporter [Paenibacillus aurantius]|uniref:MFS transporter n=1 Tax=Paenibacillus aurantius TaxID=2918900 RepID=A0AA96RFG5_9BACL|nr:MFS transporter [Paenibacillus aurantius]WNQ11218.1 MFS transporter [Paenibacillus aurantius]